jgi:hypothetical protein
MRIRAIVTIKGIRSDFEFANNRNLRFLMRSTKINPSLSTYDIDNAKAKFLDRCAEWIKANLDRYCGKPYINFTDEEKFFYNQYIEDMIISNCSKEHHIEWLQNTMKTEDIGICLIDDIYPF